MKLVAALAVALACSAPPRRRAPRRPPPPEPIAPTQPDVHPVPTLHRATFVTEGPHGGAIFKVASTPDGRAVLSADDLGGLRLWPTLDGTQEPRVIHLPAPRQLALGRRAGGGYTAVSLDEVGGLYVAKVDVDGRIVSHVSLPTDPAYKGMGMTDHGLLAWRADQTFELIDGDGVVASKLPTEPGVRMIAAAVNAKHAVVLLQREGTKFGLRALALQPKLAWGAWLDSAVDLAKVGKIAISPSAKRVAVLSSTDPRTHEVAVIDLADKGKSLGDGPVISNGADLAFVEEHLLAIGSIEGIAWLDLKAATPSLTSINRAVTSAGRAGPVLAAGDRRAISSTNGELVLVTPADTYFLGYQLPSPRVFHAGGGGQLLVGVGETFSLLDKDLRDAGTLKLAIATGSSITQLRWLEGDEWMAEMVKPGTAMMMIAVLDIAKGTSTIVRPELKDSHVLLYEPSTQLATLSFGSGAEVARYDAKTHKLETVASLGKPSPYEQAMLVPVAPKLAGGTQLLHVNVNDKPTVKWIRDPRAIGKASAAVTIDGSYAGASAAGHVFMWRVAGALELAVYVDGKPIGTIPTDGPVSLWPDPTGARVVQVGAHAIGLYQVDGKLLWQVPLAGTQEAVWLADGGLAITSAGGIARLDPANGAILAARCGWRFGLSAKPHPPTSRIEPLCSQVAP